jgi:MOSC domain-containing protein YiiM
VSTGRLEAIWIKRVRRGPMDAVDQAQLVAGQGLAGNANQDGRRQVTIIEREVFEQLRESLGEDVEPRMRRANLMVSGVRLEGARGRILRLGACRILLHGETRPCNLMEETRPGLLAALDPHWRGGAYGEVLDGGTIRIGDPAALESPASVKR